MKRKHFHLVWFEGDWNVNAFFLFGICLLQVIKCFIRVCSVRLEWKYGTHKQYIYLKKYVPRDRSVMPVEQWLNFALGKDPRHFQAQSKHSKNTLDLMCKLMYLLKMCRRIFSHETPNFIRSILFQTNAFFWGLWPFPVHFSGI